MASLGTLYRDGNTADSRADAYIDLDKNLDRDGRSITDPHSDPYPAPQRYFDGYAYPAAFQHAKTAYDNIHPCADVDFLSDKADQYQGTLADSDAQSNSKINRNRKLPKKFSAEPIFFRLFKN